MLDTGTIVTARIAGREVAAEVVDDDVEASYGPGPQRLLKLEVPGAGTWRVPQSDITAPA
jgi:hypothetical protein